MVTLVTEQKARMCLDWLTGLKTAIGSAFILWSNSRLAQVTPDTALGAEGSVVTPNVEIRSVVSDRVDGGAIRGTNLFHSFQEFNVREGRGVYFTNPQGIENIFSRVTGANYPVSTKASPVEPRSCGECQQYQC